MSNRSQYDAELKTLSENLTAMGRCAADAVENALEALCTADAEAAEAVVRGDAEVNRQEREIEHRCMTLLLRQQPVAGDLRRVSAALKVVTDLERIADHCSNIAGCVVQMQKSRLDIHGYLDSVRTGSEEYRQRYNFYARKYALV